MGVFGRVKVRILIVVKKESCGGGCWAEDAVGEVEDFDVCAVEIGVGWSGTEWWVECREIVRLGHCGWCCAISWWLDGSSVF